MRGERGGEVGGGLYQGGVPGVQSNEQLVRTGRTNFTQMMSGVR